MEILKKSFTEWWKSLTPAKKDEIAVGLSRECNAALTTIFSWGWGYRTPKGRSQEIIVKYLMNKGIKTDCKILFPAMQVKENESQ
jgi:hypothetical protein